VSFAEPEAQNWEVPSPTADKGTPDLNRAQASDEQDRPKTRRSTFATPLEPLDEDQPIEPSASSRPTLRASYSSVESTETNLQEWMERGVLKKRLSWIDAALYHPPGQEASDGSAVEARRLSSLRSGSFHTDHRPETPPSTPPSLSPGKPQPDAVLAAISDLVQKVDTVGSNLEKLSQKVDFIEEAVLRRRSM
jgi:hypothetical protein